MSKLLNIYFTAGFPELNATSDILLALQHSKADIIEIGLPFSDPLADGPTIQQSSKIALDNGMNTDVLFNQLQSCKEQITKDVYIMCYLNQVMVYGFERFCLRAVETSVTGLILPDLPPDHYEENYRQIVEQASLKMVFLITPETSPDRVERAVKMSTGFVYFVSSHATTGAEKTKINTDYFQKIKKVETDVPKLIGFGISDHAGFRQAGQYADGAIVGSAFIRYIKNGFSRKHIEAFVREIRGNDV